MQDNEHLTIEQLDYLDAILQKSTNRTSFSWVQYFFYYLQVLLPNKNTSVPFACVLIIVSFCQLGGLLISSKTQFDNFAPIEGFIIDIFQGATVYHLIADYGSGSLYFLVLYSIMGLIIILILMGVWSRFFPKGGITHFLQWSVPVLYWIGVVPVTLTMFSIWDCPGKTHPIDSTLNCWSTAHIVHTIIVSTFIAIWLCLITPVLAVVMSYADYQRDNAFAHFAFSFEANYIVLRIMICVIEALEVPQAMFYILMAIILFTLVYFFSFTSSSFSYYEPAVAVSFSTCVLATAALSSVNYFLDLINSFKIKTSGGNALVFIILLLSYFFVVKLRKKRIQGLIENQRHTSPEDLDMFIKIYAYKKVLNFYVEDVDDTAIEGFLSLHERQCNTPECPLCNRASLTPILPPKGVAGPDAAEGIVQRHFVAYLWGDKNHKDILDIRAMLQISRIYLYVLGNPHRAYEKLMEAVAMDPSWFMQFMIFVIKMDIIAFVETKKRMMYKKGTCNFTKVMELELIVYKMRNKVIEATERRLDFWNQLKMPMPSLNVLRDVGYSFLEINWKIKTYWKATSDIYPTHVKAIELYVPYLLYVLGEPDEAINLQERIDEKPDLRNWKEIDTHSLFADKSASILISGNAPDAGRILKASEKVTEVFDFNPDELVGRDITILMPKILGQSHGGFLKEFSKAGTEKAKRPFILAFGLNNAGYVFPIKVAHQQICTFQLGITHIGIVQQDINAEVHDYIITDSKGRIEGISKSLGELLNIKPAVINIENIMIQYLCEEIRVDKPSEFEELSGSKRLRFNVPRDLKRMVSNDTFKKFYNHFSRVKTAKQGEDSGKRSSQMDVRQDIESIHLVAKCEISNMAYDGGKLKIKVFQFPKTETMNQNEGGAEAKKGLHTNIMGGVLASVHNVKKRRGSLILSRRVRFLQSKDRKNLSSASVNPRDDEEGQGSSDKLHKFMSEMTTGKSPLAFIQRLLQQARKKSSASLATEPPKVPLAGASLPSTLKPPSMVTMAPQGIVDISRGEDDERAPLTSQALPEPIKINLNDASPKGEKEGKKSDRNKGLRKNKMSAITTATTTSKSVSKMLKQIRSISFASFSPRSIFRLNWMGWTFILILFTMVIVRSIFGVYYTGEYKTFPSLLLHNNDRQTSIVKITKSIIHLLLLSPTSSGDTILDLAARDSYSYNEFKNEAVKENITGFKEWTMSNLRAFTPTLQSSEDKIGQYMDSFSASKRAMIDPDSMPINYPIGKEFFSTYYVSAKDAVSIVIDHCYKLINMTKSGGNLTTSDFSTMFAKEATTNDLTEGVANSIKGIMDSCSMSYDVHMMISLSILIALACALGVFLIVIFPFLTVVNKDLATSLRMLLKIKKADVRNQLNKLSCFVAFTVKGDDRRERMQEKSEEEEPLQQAADSSPDIVGHTPGNEEAPRKKQKEEAYLPYKGNQYKVMFFMLVICGSIIGLYVGLDETVKNFVSHLLIQLEEIARYSQLISGNIAFISNIYEYIMTEGNGTCSRQPCFTYLENFFSLRQAQITAFVVGHKFNESIFSKTYDDMFHQYIEDNPCKSNLFATKSYCTTLMNGIFTHGAAAANIAFYDYGASIFNDYALTRNHTTSVKTFINDERLIKIEMLHESLLEPTYQYILWNLKDLVLQRITSEVSIILLFFAGFVFIFVISGFVCWRQLIWSMKRSIFDTKVIVANLPPDIITGNSGIYEYLSRSKGLD